MIITMKFLGVCLMLCTLLNLSQAAPAKGNSTMGMGMGKCEYLRSHDPNLKCDQYGYFLPQQCYGDEYWCVDATTGMEVPNTRTPPGTPPVDCEMEYHCPDGWTKYGERCFMFVDSRKSWIEAEGYCMFEEANLASIHSYEEQHFVQGLTRGGGNDFPETWIGGQDAVQSSIWLWSDGTEFGFHDWCMEYPMKTPGHCLKMNYGSAWNWNCCPCDNALPFVCAKSMHSMHM